MKSLRSFGFFFPQLQPVTFISCKNITLVRSSDGAPYRGSHEIPPKLLGFFGMKLEICSLLQKKPESFGGIPEYSRTLHSGVRIRCGEESTKSKLRVVAAMRFVCFCSHFGVLLSRLLARRDRACVTAKLFATPFQLARSSCSVLNWSFRSATCSVWQKKKTSPKTPVPLDNDFAGGFPPFRTEILSHDNDFARGFPPCRTEILSHVASS